MPQEVEVFFVTGHQLARLKREVAKLYDLVHDARVVHLGDLVHVQDTLRAVGFQPLDVLTQWQKDTPCSKT
jgi:hypothetical protein